MRNRLEDRNNPYSSNHFKNPLVICPQQNLENQRFSQTSWYRRDVFDQVCQNGDVVVVFVKKSEGGTLRLLLFSFLQGVE